MWDLSGLELDKKSLFSFFRAVWQSVKNSLKGRCRGLGKAVRVYLLRFLCMWSDDRQGATGAGKTLITVWRGGLATGAQGDWLHSVCSQKEKRRQRPGFQRKLLLAKDHVSIQASGTTATVQVQAQQLTVCWAQESPGGGRVVSTASSHSSQPDAAVLPTPAAAHLHVQHILAPKEEIKQWFNVAVTITADLWK